MPDLTLRCIAGRVPEPDELIGREGILRDIRQYVDGNNILLVAPRRFGKSGVMRHMMKRPRGGFVPVSLEVEDVDSPAAFVLNVMRDWWGRFYRPVGKATTKESQP